MIEDKDLSILKKGGKDKKDVLSISEEMGYFIDRDFVIELITKGVYVRRAFQTTDSLNLYPREFEGIGGSGLRGTLKSKVENLFGKDPFQLIAISHYYNKKTPQLKTDEQFVRKKYQLPESYVKIIRGTNMYQCKSIDEIKKFKLSEDDEIVRRKFKFSD